MPFAHFAHLLEGNIQLLCLEIDISYHVPDLSTKKLAKTLSHKGTQPIKFARVVYCASTIFDFLKLILDPLHELIYFPCCFLPCLWSSYYLYIIIYSIWIKHTLMLFYAIFYIIVYHISCKWNSSD